MRHFFLILVTAFISFSASAQSKFLSNASEAKRVSEGIVASFASGNYPGAWKELKPISVIPSSEFDVFEAQFNSQSGDMLRRFGSALDYEFVNEQAFGKSLVKYQFVVRHEKAAMRWFFIFYRAEKGWVLTDFKFDGNASTFFP
jgi:hypothetical protein